MRLLKESIKMIKLSLTEDQLETIEAALETYCIGLCEEKDPHLAMAADAQKAIEVLQQHSECTKVALIGEVTHRFDTKVVLQTPWGSERFLEPPKGELLPRIC